MATEWIWCLSVIVLAVTYGGAVLRIVRQEARIKECLERLVAQEEQMERLREERDDAMEYAAETIDMVRGLQASAEDPSR